MSAALTLPTSMRIFERGWLSANNILFIGRDETALVDSGYLTHAPQTLALVRHALDDRRLDRLVNTHLHSDHCGGNAALQAQYGCFTEIPVAEADAVRAWDADALSYKATGQQCARFGFDGTVAPGDELALGDLRWQALAAPGHDPRSLIFYCAEEGILISADALWENGFGVIFPELDGESGFAEARDTLALTRAVSRLDYLQADPRRNAENAVKVMLKFLLLERQHIALDEVAPMFASIPVLAAARARFLHRESAELAEWAINSLVRAGVARREGALLVNSDR